MQARQQPHLSPADTAHLSRVSMLLGGRTRVLRAGLQLVEAVVFLIDGGQYRLGYRAGAWWCQCGSPRPPCAHVRALQLVTMPEHLPLTRGSHPLRAGNPQVTASPPGARQGGTGMSDRETVELLWRVFTEGSVPIPADPGTWRIRGRVLTLAELHRVRAATADDWDGLGLLMQLRGDDLADEHARVLARLHHSDGGRRRRTEALTLGCLRVHVTVRLAAGRRAHIGALATVASGIIAGSLLSNKA